MRDLGESRCIWGGGGRPLTIWAVSYYLAPSPWRELHEVDLDLHLADGIVALFCVDLSHQWFQGEHLVAILIIELHCHNAWSARKIHWYQTIERTHRARFEDDGYLGRIYALIKNLEGELLVRLVKRVSGGGRLDHELKRTRAV